MWENTLNKHCVHGVFNHHIAYRQIHPAIAFHGTLKNNHQLNYTNHIIYTRHCTSNRFKYHNNKHVKKNSISIAYKKIFPCKIKSQVTQQHVCAQNHGIHHLSILMQKLLCSYGVSILSISHPSVPAQHMRNQTECPSPEWFSWIDPGVCLLLIKRRVSDTFIENILQLTVLRPSKHIPHIQTKTRRDSSGRIRHWYRFASLHF